ncbi:MAG TPA: nicotinate (nicotinamide) nucleotide adenylyltransferase [Patescibacteria group bacterium]
MQIALFGGRFDPVHNGHVAIAKEVLKAVPSIDEVWMVPDNHHHLNPTVVSAKQRLEMLRLIENDPSINAQERIKASDIGILVSKYRNNMTVTIDVIRALQGDPKYTKEIASMMPSQKDEPNTYLFIAGADQLPRLTEWYEYKELHMRLPFLIFPRKGYKTSGDLPEGCMWLSDREFEPMEDSASRVREYLKNGKDISTLVPKSIAGYIRKKGLYK